MIQGVLHDGEAVKSVEGKPDVGGGWEVNGVSLEHDLANGTRGTKDQSED